MLERKLGKELRCEREMTQEQLAETLSSLKDLLEAMYPELPAPKKK